MAARLYLIPLDEDRAALSGSRIQERSAVLVTWQGVFPSMCVRSELASRCHRHAKQLVDTGKLLVDFRSVTGSG
jgi:hypothetical protein